MQHTVKTAKRKMWLCALALVSTQVMNAKLVQAQNDSITASPDAEMLVATLSEEKTEINTLAAQQAMFRRMGDRESIRLARLWGMMIRDHKAGSPMLMRLARANGGDPMAAKILKPPALGDKAKMLHATHMDHEAAVRTSQMRWAATTDRAIKNAMRKRANLARKHIRWMMPYMRRHMSAMESNMNGMQMAAMCPHCNVKLKDGKCPMCGMTMEQMQNHNH